MPYVKDSSSSGGSDSESIPHVFSKDQRVVHDWEYTASELEPPLSEQLEPIAVIGMGCRLPGDVASPADFWNMMLNKGSGQTPKVPSSRFNIDAHFHENNDRPGSFGVLGGYFLNETLQEFDPNFFGVTPVEAMWMDPQQRKLLEVVYEAFESASVTLQHVSGSDTACFIATFTSDFQQMSFKEHSFRHSLAATGVDPGIISNRISHIFNLQGPSIVVNTACSSSVYAIHNACNALRTKECSAAVVGGSNLILTVDQHMNTAKLGVLSPNSTCYTFNEHANGYGRAEGVGAVYLKRLSDAIRDGNPIRGLIRSSATNNNGKVPGVGITHPSYDGQCAVIRHSYRRGGPLDPALTGYFECHGTGTAIGDPLEVRAVADSMNGWRSENAEPLMIGAVKTNIGHSGAASGLSAVIKAILTVERGIIPPTRGVTKLNPKIDWKGWKVGVPTEPTPFPAHLPVRRVSVNSFGYGGTNAHIIVEGFPKESPRRPPLKDTSSETMRTSLHTAAEGQSSWWDFSVSSVAEGGHIKEHMAGSIATTDRRQGQSKRVIPNLPQRASGKSWNQALNTVGFYYGPTFQDMDNIRFDGKTYAATCDTRIKTTVEGMLGESRHIIHPASVDSCLQLLIVANWAGRSAMMTSGALPIQVDEVTIWKPTAEQVDAGNATAFSWISPRGVRAFNGHSELKANDGELLMQIRDMRCMAYEAAVPQHAGDPAKPQPYAEMAWKLDVDSLSGTVDLDVASFAELFYFKKPDSKILICGEETLEAVLAKLPSAQTVTAVAATTELADDLETRYQGVDGLAILQCDLSQGLEKQSIKEHSYDLLLVPGTGGSLHTIHNLLAPGGKAVIDFDHVLTNGYVEAGMLNKGMSLGNHSTIVLSGASEVHEGTHLSNGDSIPNVHLLYRKKAPVIMDGIRSALAGLGFHVTASSIVDYVDGGGIVLVLAELEGALLQTITEEEFHCLQRITNTARNILWITAGGHLAGQSADSAMASGLIRALTSEQVSLNAMLIDFDMDATSHGELFRIVGEKTMELYLPSQRREKEYCVSGGQVFISRLVPNRTINDAYSPDVTKLRPTVFDPQLPMVGKLQSGKIVFEIDNRTEDSLDSELVEVRVLSTGLNKEDAVIASGSDFPTDLSHEIGGTVLQTGAAATDFSVGDQVVGFSFDKFATVQRVHRTHLQKLAPGESLVEMTSLPMTYGGALYGLQALAHLQSGEVVLVLAGTGLAGAAAVRITQALGGYPYVMAKDTAQADYTRSHFGLETHQVLIGEQISTLRDFNGNYRADIIFSSGWVAPAVAREAWRHIAPFGRFINCGRKDVLSRSTLDTIPLHRGAHYLSYDLLELHKHKPQVMAQLLADSVDLFRQGRVPVALPLHQKNIAHLDEAIALFSDDFQAGKTIIMHEPSEGMINLLPTQPRLRLRADATYLLVGCLGGLGRSLTSWMMKRGARNFAFLSRSGADSTQASILVKDLENAGVTVQVFRGDAGVRENVEAAVREIPDDRPVRGVINAAMVLKDGLFHNMPYKDWTSCIHPKVNGTKVLHDVLQDTSLDFFVATSSVSGILGTSGQSNYAAANSYLDALARHRRSLQQRSVSIILPMILGIGVVAENAELEDSLKRKGMYGIDEEGVLNAFEVAIMEQGQGISDHLVVGLDPAELFKVAQEAGGEVERFWESDARFSHTVHAMKSQSNDATAGGGQSILASIQTLPAHEAVDTVRQHFVAKLARMLMLNVEDFEEEGRSVASYGIDSMIGAELRNWVFKELGLDISFQQLLGPTLTIEKFAEQVCVKQGMEVA